MDKFNLSGGVALRLALGPPSAQRRRPASYTTPWDAPLARNADKYSSHLAACDSQRRNDLDGRGNLSEETLVDFTHYFLEVCLDQIEFMEGLMRPKELRGRIMAWADDEIRLKRLHEKAKLVLDHIHFNGSLERKDLPGIVGVASSALTRGRHGASLSR